MGVLMNSIERKIEQAKKLIPGLAPATGAKLLNILAHMQARKLTRSSVPPSAYADAARSDKRQQKLNLDK